MEEEEPTGEEEQQQQEEEEEHEDVAQDEQGEEDGGEGEVEAGEEEEQGEAEQAEDEVHVCDDVEASAEDEVAPPVVQEVPVFCVDPVPVQERICTPAPVQAEKVGPNRGQVSNKVVRKMMMDLWASKAMLQPDIDKQVVMKTSLRELVLYCMFLFVIVYMTFSQYSRDYFHLSSQIKEAFREQYKVTKIVQIWNYTEEHILEGLYNEELYNQGRKNRPYTCPDGTPATKTCDVLPMDRNVMFENRLLGVPRVRQLRVTDNSCPVYKDFRRAIIKCYAPYSPIYEDTSGRVPKYKKYTSNSAWTYSTAEELKAASYIGLLATYQGGGSYQNLHYQQNISTRILDELKDNLWIDRATRFVTFDFTVYNANVNLFAVVKIIFELPATGGVLPSMDVQVVKLLKYNTPSDYFLMGAELLFIAFTFYYLIQEWLEFRASGAAYFADLGNIIDIVVIGASVSQILLNVYMFLSVKTKIEELLQLPFEFADFSQLANFSKAITYISGFNVFIAWIKVFKYTNFNKTMQILSGTLSSCAKELSGFSVMFFIIFFAFSYLGYLLFGSQIKDYRTVILSVYTMFRTMLGDFDLGPIEHADRTFGPLYLMGYIFFVFFVLLNVFLAIINDTYGGVKEKVMSMKPAFQLGDFFMVGVNNVRNAAGIQDRRTDVDTAVKRTLEEAGVVTYQALRSNLKKSNFSDQEIDMFFDMFKEDPAMDGLIVDQAEVRTTIVTEKEKPTDSSESGALEEGAQEEAARPLSGRQARQMRSARIRSAAQGEENVNPDRFMELQERMFKMENIMDPIGNKIDILLLRLDEMKKSRKKRRQKSQPNGIFL